MQMVQCRETKCGTLQTAVTAMQNKIDSDATLMRHAEGKYNFQKQELTNLQEEHHRASAALTQHQAQVADLQRQLNHAHAESRSVANGERLSKANTEIADLRQQLQAASGTTATALTAAYAEIEQLAGVIAALGGASLGDSQAGELVAARQDIANLSDQLCRIGCGSRSTARDAEVERLMKACQELTAHIASLQEHNTKLMNG